MTEPDPDLFHVTTKWKAKSILENGLMAGMPTSERQGYLRAWMDEEGIDTINPEILEKFHQEHEPPHQRSSEEWAREKLNELLPDHYGSLFFWADEDKAEQVKKQMERKTRGKGYVIIGVDSDKLPKDGYVADFELSDEIFGELVDIYESNLGYEEEEERMEEIYDMVKKYKESVEEYDGQDDPSVEVLYPESVPREAIVTLIGTDVSLDPSQSTLREFNQSAKGKGWWKEPYRHSLASKGITTRWKK